MAISPVSGNPASKLLQAKSSAQAPAESKNANTTSAGKAASAESSAAKPGTSGAYGSTTVAGKTSAAQAKPAYDSGVAGAKTNAAQTPPGGVANTAEAAKNPGQMFTNLGKAFEGVGQGFQSLGKLFGENDAKAIPLGPTPIPGGTQQGALGKDPNPTQNFGRMGQFFNTLGQAFVGIGQGLQSLGTMFGGGGLALPNTPGQPAPPVLPAPPIPPPAGGSGSQTNAAQTGGGGYGGSQSGAQGSGSAYGQPPGPGGQPPIGGKTPGQPGNIDRNIDFTKLSPEERSKLGLNDRDRAILHLWGRQVISRGYNDGGIYSNVLAKDSKFTEAEKQLVTDLRAKEQAQYGGDTGKGLDQEFFGLYQRITGVDISQKYGNTPVRRSAGAVDITSDLDVLAKRTGLNDVEQAVLRQWGHEPLFNGGKIDGSLAPYTLLNQTALDGSKRAGEGRTNIDGTVMGLLVADLASDGVRNGDALTDAFVSTLDKVYLGGPGTDLNQISNNAANKAQSLGRTAQDVVQSVGQGVSQAFTDIASHMRSNPVQSTLAAGGMAAASSVCPFLGGMGAARMGAAAGAK